MSQTISFFVPGVPRTAGSKNVFINPKTGRPIITDDSGAQGRQWRRSVQAAAAAAYQGELLTGPLGLATVYFLARPRGHYGEGRNADRLLPSARPYPSVRPDLLKYTRAIEDALNKVIWRDDAQVVSEILDKRYADGESRPGVLVVVAQLPDETWPGFAAAQAVISAFGKET